MNKKMKSKDLYVCEECQNDKKDLDGIVELYVDKCPYCDARVCQDCSHGIHYAFNHKM